MSKKLSRRFATRILGVGRLCSCVVLTGIYAVMTARASLAEEWNALANKFPYPIRGQMVLLTDGSVLVRGGVNATSTKTWAKLTPDSSGNYVHGTWTTNIAPMSLPRQGFSLNMLSNGKVLVMGGGFKSGEIYDPATNSWASIAPVPSAFEFSDSPTILLPNGKVLCGTGNGPLTYLYDPLLDKWTLSGSKIRKDSSGKETWVLLPDGSVLSYDANSLPAGHSQRYVPTQEKWVDDGTLAKPLKAGGNGPGALLPNGNFIQFASGPGTALYDPIHKLWTRGPSAASNITGFVDSVCATLPNGQLLVSAQTTSGFRLYNYNYNEKDPTRQLADVTPAALAPQLTSTPNMLMLPNGHLLFDVDGSTLFWEYSPTGIPSSGWLPAIVGSPVKNKDGSFTLTGTQMTGISNSASTIATMTRRSPNYPLVRLTSTAGKVFFANTTKWTPGIATGSAQSSTVFKMPSTLPVGAYSLSVVANGIASKPITFSYTGSAANNVAALLVNGVLTITGDESSNSITVNAKNGQITVEGMNGTRINSGSSYVTSSSGSLTLKIDLGDGNDVITFIGVNTTGKTSDIHLGAGNDTATFEYCNMGIVNLVGGGGVTFPVTVSSKFEKLNQTN